MSAYPDLDDARGTYDDTAGDDQPTRSELIRDAWDEANTPLPSWIRKPLHVTKPNGYGHGGWPHQTLTCDDHPDWRRTVDPFDVVNVADRHIRIDHRGQTEEEVQAAWHARDVAAGERLLEQLAQKGKL